MKLDRNESAPGIGKFILINTRKLVRIPLTPQELATAILLHPECVEFGEKGSRDEAFVIKLKDINAQPALREYAKSAALHDVEYAEEVSALSERSGVSNRYCKYPD